MLKFSEVKDMDEKVLRTKLSEKRREVFDFRVQKHTSALETPHQYKLAKKEVAMLLTALNNKK